MTCGAVFTFRPDLLCWSKKLLCEIMPRRLTDALKDMVAHVSDFFQNEKDGGHRLHVKNVVRRAALACGVSENTVGRFSFHVCNSKHVKRKNECQT